MKLSLKSLAMRRPNANFVNAISKLRQPKTVTKDELKRDFTPTEILVSFEKDGVSNPQSRVVWQKGVEGRFIVDSELPAGYRTD